MSDRITKANIEERVANVNRRMESLGSKVRYESWSTSGRQGLFRRTADSKPGTVDSDVRFGTKNEIGEFLYAMMVALDDASNV